MSMDQLMALVPIEAATTLSSTHQGRKSRWERAQVISRENTRFGRKNDKPYLPPPFIDLPFGLTPLQVDQFLREQRLDELTAKLERGELEMMDPDIRPPSPPPAYDKNGNRTNTRDVRVRSEMVAEHQRLLEYMVTKVPGFIPPNDFKPTKKIRRIIIPQDKFPEYNFMGLIIGPRGCNHKRLEAESGTQISIRGRGTQKEGKKTDHQTEEEASMPQHVHIAADTEESLDKAVALIEPLLNPYHPAHEEFKKKGLEQLALVNGVTVSKLEHRCTVCGATTHMSWECPDTEFQSFQKAEVKCALCGDKGHVTMDCKLAVNLTKEQLVELEKKAKPKTVNSDQGNTAHHGPHKIPPPPVGFQPGHTSRLDHEYSQMISEMNDSGASGGLGLLPDTPIRSGMNPLDTFASKYNPGQSMPLAPSSNSSYPYMNVPNQSRKSMMKPVIPPPPVPVDHMVPVDTGGFVPNQSSDHNHSGVPSYYNYNMSSNYAPYPVSGVTPPPPGIQYSNISQRFVGPQGMATHAPQFFPMLNGAQLNNNYDANAPFYGFAGEYGHVHPMYHMANGASGVALPFMPGGVNSPNVVPDSSQHMQAHNMQEMSQLMTLMYSGVVLTSQQMERLSQLMSILYPTMSTAPAATGDSASDTNEAYRLKQMPLQNQQPFSAIPPSTMASSEIPSLQSKHSPNVISSAQLPFTLDTQTLNPAGINTSQPMNFTGTPYPGMQNTPPIANLSANRPLPTFPFSSDYVAPPPEEPAPPDSEQSVAPIPPPLDESP